MNTEHRQQKISFWHSMKTQFIAVVILVAAVIVILYTLMIMPGVKSNIRSIYSNYLLDLSISYGREVESAMQVNADFLDNPEAAQDILQQLDVAGAKTAYAYLVGFDGTMLYHPTAEKIGQPVENDAVKKILNEIQGGSIPKPETVQYVFQGEKKFSACYTSKKQFILVVTADDADLLAPALMLEQRGILISGVLLLIGALAAFVFATRITRPLLKITDSVNRIAQLDLRNDQVLEQCAAHRGEVGSIANAVLRMKDAGLPSQVMEQANKLMQRAKLPIVKAKVGPRVMTLIADEQIYDDIPVKKEVKATVSGLYITGVRGLRGPLEKPVKKKKGFRARLQEKYNETNAQLKETKSGSNKKKK